MSESTVPATAPPTPTAPVFTGPPAPLHPAPHVQPPAVQPRDVQPHIGQPRGAQSYGGQPYHPHQVAPLHPGYATPQQAYPSHPHPAAPTTVAVLGSHKSVPAAAILGFLFGPLGMLYSTITGAAIMFAVNLVVGPLTLGLGLLLSWPACAVWAAVAANTRNNRLAALGVPKV